MEIKRVQSAISKNLTTAIKDLNGLEGKVGWFKDSRYPASEGGQYVAEIAAQNEYGNPSKNIPARPFMRPTVIEKQNAWLAFAAKLATQVLEDKLTAHQAMESIAIMAENDVIKKIKSITSPPLAQATIKARLNKYKDKKTIGALNKPLIDTGYMIATLTHEVSKT
jgi:phage gpG-like protein